VNAVEAILQDPERKYRNVQRMWSLKQDDEKRMEQHGI